MNEIEILNRVATSNFTTTGILTAVCIFLFYLLKDKKEMTEHFRKMSEEMKRANDIKELESEYLKHFFDECRQIKDKVNELYNQSRYAKREE